MQHPSANEAFLAARDFLLEHRTDYETAVGGFDWPDVGDTFNWVTDYFDMMADGNDQRALHLLEEDGTAAILTYDELARRSRQVANLLVANGATRGDRILVMLGNETALWETMLAAMRIGAVVIPATTLLSGPDLADRFERGGASMVVTNQGAVGNVDALDGSLTAGVTRIAVGGGDGWIDLGESQSLSDEYATAEATRSADPLLEYFTSGTTSKPKLVRHTHVSYPVGHLSTMYWLGLQPGDVHWTISSPGWAKHAWSCFFAPFNAQACVFIYNYTRFDAPTVLQVLIDHQVKTLCAPPTVWRFLIQAELSDYEVALRELISAGEPLNPEVIAQVEKAWGIRIRDGYGQTETTAQIGNTPGSDLVPGSMGRPLPGYTINLLDPDGEPADEGEISIDLAARPVGLMEAYADDDTKTDEVMRHGHYHTGDVASRDERGYVTYVGRADDVFKASGYRISPFELESVLIEHPAVAEAAVVPSPDELRGFVPKAYVILAEGHQESAETAGDILGFVRERVSGYKLIRRLEFGELPKTISGKIRRVELRGQETARVGEGPRNDAEYLERDVRS
ncbi:MAG: AMP-binding protein [Actinomycetota bacterium]